jgi:hypothetical protein
MRENFEGPRQSRRKVFKRQLPKATPISSVC